MTEVSIIIRQNQGKQKLERGSIDQHEKQQNPVEKGDIGVHYAITPEKYILIIPDQEKKGKTNTETYKSFHGLEELIKGFGHFKRDDDQRNGKSKNSIAESFEPGRLIAPPADRVLFKSGCFF